MYHELHCIYYVFVNVMYPSLGLAPAAGFPNAPYVINAAQEPYTLIAGKEPCSFVWIIANAIYYILYSIYCNVTSRLYS